MEQTSYHVDVGNAATCALCDDPKVPRVVSPVPVQIDGAALFGADESLVDAQKLQTFPTG